MKDLTILGDLILRSLFWFCLLLPAWVYFFFWILAPGIVSEQFNIEAPPEYIEMMKDNLRNQKH